MTEPFRASVDIAAPPESVFPYLTEPRALLTWMGDHADLEATPGGGFSVDINGIPVRGSYLVVDAPRRLVITWGHAGSAVLPTGSSTLEVTLTATATGTRVEIEHRDLPQEELADHALGWPHYLARLVLAASGADPGPDPFARPQPEPGRPPG